MPLGEETKSILCIGKGRAVARLDRAQRRLVQAVADLHSGRRRRPAVRRLKEAHTEVRRARAVMGEWEA